MFAIKHLNCYILLMAYGAAITSYCLYLQSHLNPMGKYQTMTSTAPSTLELPVLAPNKETTPLMNSSSSMIDTRSLNKIIQHGKRYCSLNASTLPPIEQTPFVISNKDQQPLSTWNNTFPDITIAGYPKTGTSHMYQLLAGHARIRTAHHIKEFCYYGGNEVKRNTFIKLYDYRKQLYLRRLELLMNESQTATTKETTLTVNGCIYGSSFVEVNYRYIPPRGEKFILLYRDPADWLWAAWNFYTDPLVDNTTSPLVWATIELEYRTPELFHEIVASNGKLKVFHSLFSRIQTATWDGMRLVQLVGRQNVLFVRTEDLEPAQIESSGTLQQLATFLSIRIQDFGNETGQRTNCNNNKGPSVVCKDSIPGVYQISGNRKMLDTTRYLIYSFFQSACTTWYEQFDLDYPNCRNSI